MCENIDPRYFIVIVDPGKLTAGIRTQLRAMSLPYYLMSGEKAEIIIRPPFADSVSYTIKEFSDLLSGRQKIRGADIRTLCNLGWTYYSLLAEYNSKKDKLNSDIKYLPAKKAYETAVKRLEETIKIMNKIWGLKTRG